MMSGLIWNIFGILNVQNRTNRAWHYKVSQICSMHKLFLRNQLIKNVVLGPTKTRTFLELKCSYNFLFVDKKKLYCS